jgi:ectoine hydroxylase-related dioxygenase (phytanoyl-CoA dioxygenase family)
MKNLDYNYDSDGFVILRDAIDKNLIMELRSYAADLLKCDVTPSNILKAMEQLENSNKEGFYEFTKIIGETIPAIKIALIPHIFELAKQMTGFQNLHLMGAAFFNKKAITRLQYDWHQEKSYYPNAEEVITLWYPWLTPVNDQNGTMVMKKGGHKMLFDIERENVTDGLTQMRINDNDLMEFKDVQCNLEIGDIILFSSMSPHRTGNNQSGIPRTTLLMRYTNAEGKFDSGWTIEK